MTGRFEIYNFTALAWGVVNWWCGSGLDLHDAVGLSFGWNSSHFTCNKSVVICIYCQRQTIYFVQQCCMGRSAGIDVRDLKTNEMR